MEDKGASEAYSSFKKIQRREDDPQLKHTDKDDVKSFEDEQNMYRSRTCDKEKCSIQPDVYDYNTECSEVLSKLEMIQILYEESKPEPTPSYDVSIDQTCSQRQFAAKRLMDDIVELLNDPPSGITAIPMDDDIFLWKISILGPENSPFADKYIQGIIQFPAEYPYVPPTVMFIPTIFHPNVSENGDLCLNEIHKHWTPCFSLSSFLVSVKYILGEPSTLDPANQFAAAIINISSISYAEMARESANKNIQRHEQREA